MNLTTENYIPPLVRALVGAPPANGTRRVGIGLIPRLMLWSLEPPYRLRFRRPVFEPWPEDDPEAALTSFERLQGELLRKLGRFDGKALDRLQIASPFNERLNGARASQLLRLVEKRKGQGWALI